MKLNPGDCPQCGNALTTSTCGGDEEASVCRFCMLSGIFEEDPLDFSARDAEDYEICHEIGRGGDGAVYEAIDRKTKREVALKLMNSLRSHDKGREQRFRIEVEAIASLDHPNIIPIYATGQLDGRAFFSMKLVKGGSLANYEGKVTGPKELVPLMIKIARAIHHAHERGILHRDLKPSNILLDRSGEPFISDFGLAKQSESDTGLTMTGAVMGTPAFMSPEQARGANSQVTITSDLFSLGSVFFFLLTGKYPFGGANTHVVLRRVIEDEVSFPSDLSREVDRDLETICLKCLEKDPEKRYSTALALAEDLERWLCGEPVLARRLSPLAKAWRWVKRRPVLVSALLLAFGSLVGGGIFSFAQWRKAEAARAHAEKQQSKAQTKQLEAEQFQQQAEENEYDSVIANAYAARERFDFGEARRLLSTVKSGAFEWRLLDGLTRGDQLSSVDLGEENPLYFSYNHAEQKLYFLTSKYQLRTFDADTEEVGEAIVIPEVTFFSGTIERHPGLRYFAFAPDGKHYSIIDGNHLTIVSHPENRVVFTERCGTAADGCWLDDQRFIQVQGSLYVSWGDARDSERGSLVDLRTGEQTIFPESGWSAPVALSPDGSRLAIGRVDARGKALEVHPVRELDDGFLAQAEMRFQGRHGELCQAEFSPNGERLALLEFGSNSYSRVWRMNDGVLIDEQWWPTKVRTGFTQDSLTLLHAGRDSWWLARLAGKPRSNPGLFDDGHPDHQPFPLFGPFAPPHSLLTRTTVDGRTTLLFGHEAPVHDFYALPEKGQTLTAGEDGTIRRWSHIKTSHTPDRRENVETSYKRDHILASQNGHHVIFNDKGHHGYSVWNVPSNESVLLPPKFVPVAALNDGRVLAWDLEEGGVVCLRAEPSEPIEILWRDRQEKVSKGFGSHFIHGVTTLDERFAAALFPGKLLVIDLEKKTSQALANQIISQGPNPGQCLALSPDGRSLAVTGFAGAPAYIYHATNLSGRKRSCQSTRTYVSSDSACVYSRDGRRLFMGNNDGWVRVFETENYTELEDECWRAHSSEVTAMALSQEGEVIATAGENSITLWATQKEADLPRRQRLRLSCGTVNRSSMQFCGDDTMLIHAGPVRPIEIWRAPKTGWDPPKRAAAPATQTLRSKKSKLRSLLPF